ncbi:MAG TPA: hypothetical protein VNT31_13365 [Nocardioides sp.]|nr:hypothetical protein [Nocardioides sp.]
MPSPHARTRMETPTMDAKKLIAVVVVVFLGFWMFTDPSGLATTSKDVAGEGWSLTTQAFDGVIDFVAEL